MKYLFLLLFSFASCAEKASLSDKNELAGVRPMPLLDAEKMNPYINLLPDLLTLSEKFISSEAGRASAEALDNSSFYQFLYTQDKMAAVLKKAGFDTSEAFGEFHETVVAVFIQLMQRQDLAEEAVMQLPALKKEVDTLVLRQSRDKNNTSLNNVLNKLQVQYHFYQNVSLVAPYQAKLEALNKPSLIE